MELIPHADDLAGWVRRWAEHGLDVGGRPEPVVVVFEDDEPTLHVRPCPAADRADEATVEVLGILALLPVTHLAVAQPVRLRVPGARGRARDLSARSGMLLTVGRRGQGGDVVLGSTLVPFDRADDGRPRWDDPVDLDGRGPMESVVARVLTTTPVPRRARAGVVYAADRFGHGIAVAGAWRSRYGLDVPLRASMVRDEDRGRALASVAEVVA